MGESAARGGLGAAEAYKGLRTFRGMAVAVFEPKIYGMAGEAAAADDATWRIATSNEYVDAGWTCVNVRLSSWVGVRTIGFPMVRKKLPDVACHVVQTAGIGGIGADGAGCSDVVVEVGASLIRRFVAPRKQCVPAAACGERPLRLGREAFASPSAIRRGGVPVDVDDGMIGPGIFIGRGLPMLKIVAVVESFLREKRSQFGVGIDEPFELRVGD